MKLAILEENYPRSVRSRAAEEPMSFRGVSKRAGGLGATGKNSKQIEVSIDEGFLFGSTPFFDLMFSGSRLISSRKFLPPHEFNWEPFACPCAARAVLVFGNSFL